MFISVNCAGINASTNYIKLKNIFTLKAGFGSSTDKKWIGEYDGM